MKKALIVFLTALTLLLCACGSNTPAPTAEPTAAPETPAPAAAPEAAEATITPETPAPAAEPTVDDGAELFTFSTTDREGKVYDESVFKDYQLIMVNFWEPWCGPCVGEMADIQALYEAYADKGLLVLGIYSTPGMEEDVDAVLEMTGVHYPILLMSEDFYRFGTGFVPTTVFFDGEGHVLRHELDKNLLSRLGYSNVAVELASTVYIGSRDYAGWEEIVNEVLP
ncbi:MAG: TlpA family protein disulfide reductase [Oscillospiraceae bacterium]|nr:TlpA family protein disulfide reductase [Oscillospiraceae bacterium]